MQKCKSWWLVFILWFRIESHLTWFMNLSRVLFQTNFSSSAKYLPEFPPNLPSPRELWNGEVRNKFQEYFHSINTKESSFLDSNLFLEKPAWTLDRKPRPRIPIPTVFISIHVVPPPYLQYVYSSLGNLIPHEPSWKPTWIEVMVDRSRYGWGALDVPPGGWGRIKCKAEQGFLYTRRSCYCE